MAATWQRVIESSVPLAPGHEAIGREDEAMEFLHRLSPEIRARLVMLLESGNDREAAEWVRFEALHG